MFWETEIHLNIFILSRWSVSQHTANILKSMTLEARNFNLRFWWMRTPRVVSEAHAQNDGENGEEDDFSVHDAVCLRLPVQSKHQYCKSIFIQFFIISIRTLIWLILLSDKWIQFVAKGLVMRNNSSRFFKRQGEISTYLFFQFVDDVLDKPCQQNCNGLNDTEAERDRKIANK